MSLSPRLLPRRCVGIVVLGLLLLMVGGCGSSTGSVSGTVTYKGEPLKAGRVTFTSGDKTGQGFPAEIDENGKYSISKIPPGDYKVCVETEYLKPSPQMAMAAKTRPKDAPGGPAGATARAQFYKFIPQKYAMPEQTPLSFKVTGGSQTYDPKLD